MVWYRVGYLVPHYTVDSFSKIPQLFVVIALIAAPINCTIVSKLQYSAPMKLAHDSFYYCDTLVNLMQQRYTMAVGILYTVRLERADVNSQTQTDKNEIRMLLICINK